MNYQPTPQRAVTNAWADSFGVWHARVVTDGAVGSEAAAAVAARDRIVAELTMREGPNFAPDTVQLQVKTRKSRDGTLTFYFTETDPRTP